MNRFRVARLIEAGVGPTILAMPEGEFMVCDLPTSAGKGHMAALHADGVVQKIRTAGGKGQRVIWTRGPNYAKCRALVEEMILS